MGVHSTLAVRGWIWGKFSVTGAVFSSRLCRSAGVWFVYVPQRKKVKKMTIESIVGTNKMFYLTSGGIGAKLKKKGKRLKKTTLFIYVCVGATALLWWNTPTTHILFKYLIYLSIIYDNLVR